MKKKIIFATTGSSLILKSLIEEQTVQITAIVDFKTDAAIEHQNAIIRQGIGYYVYEDMDSLGKWMAMLEPDVLVVYKMPFLLPENIFTIPKYGSINIHPSLLPQYRGPNPWFWIYYNMEKESGVTVHFIDVGEDTGNIIYQERFGIALGERLNDLKMKADTIGTNLMIKAICNIEHIPSTPQPALSPTVRARNVFNYQGLINWEKWSVEKIWHLLNGFPEILQTNKSYIKLNKTLIPDSYCFGNNSFITGEFTLADKHYILGCIDGSIEFKCW